MGKRNYDIHDVIALLVASGGRCHICNKDIMNDWRSHEKIKTANWRILKHLVTMGHERINHYQFRLGMQMKIYWYFVQHVML